MSVNDIKKYKTILIENQIASGGKISKFEANYTDHSNSKENQCRYCNHFHNPSSCDIVLGLISPDGLCDHFEHGYLDEKWDTETNVSPSEKGKYKGKTKDQLKREYMRLKKSGPHHKGSPEYEKMKELSFAIRAKSNWGAVKEKMADKDYDKDGRIETEKDEVWGSRLRAAKNAKHRKE